MALLPDAEALLIVALRATPVGPLVGNRISTRLSGTYPAIRITLLGGPDRAMESTGQPELQVECWGNGSGPSDETQALEIARNVEGFATSLAGSYGPGRIVGAYTLGGILHSPDASSGRERYIVQVGLVTQP